MAVGDSANFSGDSYITVGRETTYGTYTTCTAHLPFLSSSMKLMKEGKILEQVETSRTYSKRIQLGKKLEGEVEAYYYPQLTGCAYLLQNAFGGTITTATSTGETTGGTALDYTFNVGNLEDAGITYKSLCLNNRKGHTTTGQVYELSGLRVAEMNFSAEIDDALKVSTSLIGKDQTATTNDVASVISYTATSVLNFSEGRISVEGTFASLTSTSIWHVQSVSFGINNNLKSESEARRIGSDTLVVLPQGIAQFTLSMTVRFDTTTAYSAMLNGTKLSAELVFQGPTISGSAIRQQLKFQFPAIYVNDSGDPEIGGPDEILSSEITFDVLRDDTSTTGYAARAILTSNLGAWT